MTNEETARIEKLISEMTVDEKLDLLDPDDSKLDYEAMPAEMRAALQDREKRFGPEYNYWMQKYHRTMTRLGIPRLLSSEALHGLNRPAATIFPQALTLSSTFDPENAYKMGLVIGAEAYACGVCEVWSPVCDLAREPRYGRTEETYGEDEYLCARFAEQVVKGIRDGSDGYVISELKHFTGYGNPLAGLNAAQSTLGRHGVFAYCNPVFEAAIKAGAVNVMNSYNSIDDTPVACDRSILTDLLRGEFKLPGFVRADMLSLAQLYHWFHMAEDHKQALLMSVKAGVDVQLHDFKHDEYRTLYKELIAEGKLTMDDLDTSVRRVLTAITIAKVFERPETDLSAMDSVMHCGKHRSFALDAARQSVVLLKNNGVLPLKKGKKRVAVIGPNAEIPVLGDYCVLPDHPAYTLLDGLGMVDPDAEFTYLRGTGVLPSGLKLLPHWWPRHAPTSPEDLDTSGFVGEYFNNHDLSGEPVLTRIDKRIDFCWIYEKPDDRVDSNAFSVRWTAKIRLERDFRGRLGFEGNDSIRLIVNGEKWIDAWDEKRKDRTTDCLLKAGETYDVVVEFKNDDRAARVAFGHDHGLETIDEAVALAKQSDVVILAVGDSTLTSGENFDRASLDLPGSQPKLLNALVESGTPLVLVLSTGRPVTLNWDHEGLSAALQAGFNGEMGGLAVAEALYGDVNPAGRLSMTYPRTIGQIPCHYSRYTSCGKIYVETDWNPAFPFGYGLSYTTFEYSDLKLDRKQIRAGETVTASFTVKNTGAVKGDVCPQLYLSDVFACIARPDMVLRGFSRVTLEPGEEKRVSYTLGFDEMRLLTADYRWIVEPGDFIVRVGDNSVDIRLEDSFTVIE